MMIAFCGLLHNLPILRKITFCYVSTANILLDSSGSGGLPKPQAHCQVYCWGNGVPLPLRLPLPHADTKLLQVSVGRAQKTAVTHNGRLIIWEVHVLSVCTQPVMGTIS